MPVAMTEILCRCGCGETKKVRTADVNRGWGLYINKSHKQKHQEQLKKQKEEAKANGFGWNIAIQEMNNLK